MRSVRRNTVDSITEPLAVVRTSLVSSSISRFPGDSSAAFSGVFADAMKGARSGKRKGYGYADLEPGFGGSKQGEEPLRPPPSLLQYNASIDLYVQLDTLLREKSLLIAVV